MARVVARKGASSGKATVRAYTSPTLVLLAMDWPDGKDFDDFLGFAILRSPGFHPGEVDGYLLNKIGFAPPGPHSQPLPSNVSPIQKFLWWDSAISDADRGKTFTYTVTPVRGTGVQDIYLELAAASEPKDVAIPEIERDGVSTWFNRAVVSSQAFKREFPDPQKDLKMAMDWLTNGLEDAFADILTDATEISGAIYHLTDNRWVVPDLKSFSGDLSLVYELRNNDKDCVPAINILKSALKKRLSSYGRSKTNIMHDKFLVDVTGNRVLIGSANYTPEGLTSQANLLHIFKSKELADLFAVRQELLRDDPTIGDTAKGAAWSAPIPVGKGDTKVRVIFSPEPKGQRVSLDTVIESINNAKQSVVFCMFSPTDPTLLQSLLAVGDKKKLLYGLLNSISNPNAKKDDLSDSGEPPKKPTASTQIKVTLYNRSQKDKKVLTYSYFRPGATPAGFLPEFSTVDMTSMSTLRPKSGGKKGAPPAVHIHHKFIVIDPETDKPTIYTGSNNLSENSTHKNDESLLEITGNTELAQTYFAEFMRLYEHFRARALFNMAHPPAKGKLKDTASMRSKLGQAFTLKTNRDAWVKGAYTPGTTEFLARTALAE